VVAANIEHEGTFMADDESAFEFEIDQNFLSIVFGFIFGAVFLVLGIGLAIASPDADGDGKVRMPIFLIPIYMIAGQIGCGIVVAIPGVLGLLGGISALMTRLGRSKTRRKGK